MNRVACHYSVIQFLPYPETGEFANIGIVLACQSKGLLDFRLERRKYSRYTGFFHNLESKVFLSATKHLAAELTRVRDLAAHHRARDIDAAFKALTHPREAIIRFGAPRAVLTQNPELELDGLFDHYVRHGFAKEANYENTMEQRVKSALDELKLATPFRQQKIGNDLYKVQFPLVQTIGDKPVKAIKPFFLGQDTPNAIYDHGDRWLSKLARLKGMNLMPDKVLFLIKGPENTEELTPLELQKRQLAFEEIHKELTSLVEIGQDQGGINKQIRDFATH